MLAHFFITYSCLKAHFFSLHLTDSHLHCHWSGRSGSWQFLHITSKCNAHRHDYSESKTPLFGPFQVIMCRTTQLLLLLLLSIYMTSIFLILSLLEDTLSPLILTSLLFFVCLDGNFIKKAIQKDEATMWRSRAKSACKAYAISGLILSLGLLATFLLELLIV